MDGLRYMQTLIQREVGEDFPFREETLPVSQPNDCQYELHCHTHGWLQTPPQPKFQNSTLYPLLFGDRQKLIEVMRLWLRGLACQALRSSWGVCRIHTQPPPPPIPEVVATWEAISLGRQPVPEYFNFAHDVLDVWSQLEKVRLILPWCPTRASEVPQILW
jgi:hypothetical protein